MRRLSATLLLVLPMIFMTCSKAASDANGDQAIQASEPAEITIQVDGLNSGLMRLVGVFTDQQYLVDTATIASNGQAVFKKEESYKQGYYYILLPNNSNFQLIISEDQTFDLHTNLADLVGTMKITGQLDNSLFYENLRYEPNYQNRYQAVTNQMQGISKEDINYELIEQQRLALIQERTAHLESLYDKAPNSLFTKFKRAGQNPELRKDVPDQEQVYWYRQQFWDGVDFTDERLLFTPVISNKLSRYITELTNQQPDSIIAAIDHVTSLIPNWKNSEYLKYIVNWVTLKYEPAETTLMDAEAIYVHMVKKYFTYEHAFWSDSANTYALQLRAEEMGNSLIGQIGPNVKAPGPDGVLHAVYDSKAPYIVVYLYNPDCEHCMEQSPLLVQLYDKWQREQNPTGDVYAIAIDTDESLWKQYIKETNMRWTNVFDPTNKSIYKTYFVNVTPEVYILNEERRIIGKNLHVNQIEEVIRRDQAKE